MLAGPRVGREQQLQPVRFGRRIRRRRGRFFAIGLRAIAKTFFELHIITEATLACERNVAALEATDAGGTLCAPLNRLRKREEAARCFECRFHVDAVGGKPEDSE